MFRNDIGLQPEPENRSSNPGICDSGFEHRDETSSGRENERARERERERESERAKWVRVRARDGAGIWGGGRVRDQQLGARV